MLNWPFLCLLLFENFLFCARCVSCLADIVGYGRMLHTTHYTYKFTIHSTVNAASSCYNIKKKKKSNTHISELKGKEKKLKKIAVDFL